jgi:redox-sensitive bicupin YhaK (pirin superfamily)
MEPRTITSVHDQTPVHGLTWVEDRQVILDPRKSEDWDPFILWGVDRFRAPGGFPDHPHRGIETATLVLEGALEHGDSAGHGGVVGTGDVQWMTAGRGIVHREMPVGDGPVRGMQLWVNLPAADKAIDPSYQHLAAADAPVRRVPGGTLRDLSGGRQPVTMLELRLDAGASLSHDLPAEANAFLYVIEGDALAGPAATPVAAGQVARSAPGGTRLDLRASTALHAVLIAGRPLGERFAFGA